MRFGRVVSWIIAITFGVAAPLAAQPEAPKPGLLIGEEQRTRDEIEAADRLAGDKRYEDAVRRYRQVLGESGDALVSLMPDEPRRAIPARWLIHRRLAALPAEARLMFTRDIEDALRKRLEQAVARRDARLLEQIVADAFISATAEQALHLLGDLAFERGEFEIAEHYWRMIVRPASEAHRKAPATALLHPAPSEAGAAARAKMILALLFRGEQPAAAAELAHFRKAHPTAKGRLAGRAGEFATTLQTLIDANERFVPGGVSDMPGWPTFAGNAARNPRIGAAMTPYLADVEQWSTPLPGDPKAEPHRDSDPPLGTGAAARSLAFQPIIVPGYALIADAARVWALNLADGKIAAEYDHRTSAGLPKSLDLRVPSRTDVCYTLTAADGRIYARFGAQPVKAPEANADAVESESVVVCLELAREPGGKSKLQTRWQLRARPLDTDPPAMFEGAPIVHAGRLYVARTRFDGRQQIVAIECYDADSGAKGEPPARRWRQEIWSAESTAETARHRHDLLTLAGPNVVYCTHAGAVVALDAASGKRAWAYRYPAAPLRAPEGVHPRDLGPCVYADGRVYAAPADSDRILCLDARTGERVWETNPTNVVQLLGVSQGKLVVTLGGFPQGIRAYHAGRGSVLWTRPDGGDLATFGRGFLTDSLIFWPTRRGLRVLRLDDGDPMDAGSHVKPLGHLALGEGYLIAATPTEILGFVPPRQSLQQRRGDVQARPESAESWYQLAVAEADSGNASAALAGLRRAAELAGDARLFGQPLRDLCERRRAELLEFAAARLVREGKRDEALALLREVSSGRGAVVDRVRAIAARNALSDSALAETIGPVDFRHTWVIGRNDLPTRAGEFVLGLLDDAGRQSLERRVAEAIPKDLDAAVESFGWARAVRAAVVADAVRLEQGGKPWPAARRFRQILTGAALERDEVKRLADERIALEGLTRIYSQQGFHAEARGLQRRLQLGDSKRSPVEPPAVAHTPEFPVPWRIDKSIRLEDERPLSPMPDPATGEEGRAADESGRFFCSSSSQLRCRSLSRGELLWRRDLNHDAERIAYFAESALVAGSGGVSRIRREDGAVLWQFVAPEWRPMPATFPAPLLRRCEPWPNRPKLNRFRLAGDRLVCRWGEQRMLALDVETGRVAWQFTAPTAPLLSADDGAGIAPHFLATTDAVLLQTTGGTLIGLDAATGRERFRRHAPSPWPDAPVAIDSRQAVCGVGPRVVSLDLVTGEARWSYTPPGWASLTGAAPQLRRDGSHLLLIVDRNYGSELQRLRIDDGQHEYGPIFLGREPVSLRRSAIAPDLFAIIAETHVLGLNRADGRKRWDVALPGGGVWRARATTTALVLHHDSAVPRNDLDAVKRRAARVLSAMPSVERLQTAAAILHFGTSRTLVRLIALAPADGRIQQEQTFNADGPLVDVFFTPHPAVVTSARIESLQSVKTP